VGWSLIAVPADPEGPAFVYSIGMIQTLDHPEIIIFGLDLSLMASVINGIGDEIRGGRPFREPGLYEGLLEGFACRIAAVAEVYHEVFLGYAMWHRRHISQIGTLEAVQCIWPDMSGRFPDEADCNPVVVQLQPLLQS
jgi:hypothetical protein